MTILADPMITEVINGAFVVTIGVGIRAIWQHGSRITALETKAHHLLTKDDFHNEMSKFRQELKNREDDIINRVQYMLDHHLGKK